MYYIKIYSGIYVVFFFFLMFLGFQLSFCGVTTVVLTAAFFFIPLNKMFLLLKQSSSLPVQQESESSAEQMEMICETEIGGILAELWQSGGNLHKPPH